MKDAADYHYALGVSELIRLKPTEDDKVHIVKGDLT